MQIPTGIPMASLETPYTPPVPVLPKAIVAPPRPLVPTSLLKRSYQLVRVELYAEHPISLLMLESEGGLEIVPSRRRIPGRIELSVDRNHVVLKHLSRIVLDLPQLKISSAEGNLINMTRPHCPDRRTSGELLISVEKGHLHVVNVLDLETYVEGTVEGELGSLNLPVEAIKSQLVASRSYILALGHQHPNRDFDFCDGAHCQVFLGVGHYPERFVKAAAATRGVYLTYHGQPAAAFYHHSCGGQTASIQDVWPGPPVPYLVRVQDGPTGHPYCGIGSRQSWRFEATVASLRQCFARQGWIRGAEALDSLKVIRYNSSGRADEVLVESSQSRWVQGDQIRRAVNRYFGREVLLSTSFTIARSGSGFEFRGKGWGHGVGMCQEGSIGMAKHGFTYKQIMLHYFPGTKLARLPVPRRSPVKKISPWARFFRHVKDSLD